MQRNIITLDRSAIDSTIDTTDRPDYNIRRAARAVVTDADGSVALLHARTRDYYKLPGGGIDNDEDIQQALARELMEEIGSTADVIAEIGEVTEWRDWEKLKQISYCFTAILKGEKGTPEFTEDELAEGFEIVWATDIDAAIGLVGSTINSPDMNVAFMTTRDEAVLRAAKNS
jgi:8-oxo-dGTP diphosphatase